MGLVERRFRSNWANPARVRSEKLASIGQLVAGIAHEINNPVNAIVVKLPRQIPVALKKPRTADGKRA